MDTNTVNTILAADGTHYWVKEQYQSATRRDIVDAINDAELLLEMLKARFKQMNQEVSL